MNVLKPAQTTGGLSNKKVVYEDPAAALNLSEDKWN
jgi:hypothetical protein